MKGPKEKLSIQKYENCHALPFRHFKINGLDVHGGGLCCDGEWITESSLFSGSLAKYDFNPDDAKYIDEDVIFIGCMSLVWGHAITDCLKHLWWLHTDEYLENHKDKRLIYWGAKPLAGNFLELVELSGVDVSKLYYVDQVMLFRSIIVPNISFNYSEGWACKEYVDTIDYIISNIKPCKKNVEKVFFSERESSRVWGVKSIEKLARSAGYMVYYPGEHSLEEQISVLRSASNVLSFESSVGHNTVFCNPQIKLIMLRKASYTNKYQSIINELRNFDVETIDASLSIMNDERYPYGGPFFVYANDAVCNSILPQKNNNNKSRRFFFKELKKYIEYSLWCDNDTLANRLIISEVQAKKISYEIKKHREWCREQICKIMKCVPLPNALKEKIITKITKYRVRHLI